LSNEYLNFSEISAKVSFKELFDYLNISYSQKNGELRTNDGIVVNINKNLYFNTKDENQKGSVINFLANYKKMDLRSAAKELKDNFLKDTAPSKREIPELELHYTDLLKNNLISQEMAKEYEVGLVKQRSIMSGKIAFRVRDINANPIGYIGLNIKDSSWFYPKDFKRPLYNAHRLYNSKEIFLVINPLDALKIIDFGFSSVGALLGRTINDQQMQTLNELKNLCRIILIHPEPENSILRISKIKFIKLFPFSNLNDLSKEEFKSYLNSPRE
jgi:DNA primase